MGGIGSVLKNELRISHRGIASQIAKHPYMALLFIFAALMMTTTIVMLFDWAIEHEGDELDTDAMSPDTDLLMGFMLLTFRGAVLAQRRVVRNPVMNFYRSQPLTSNHLLASTLVFTIISILSLFALFGLFLLTALGLTGVRPEVDPSFWPQVALALLLAPILGYEMGIVAGLQPFSRKMYYLGVLSALMALALVGINVGLAEPELAMVLIGLALLVSLVFLALMANLLQEVLETVGEGEAIHDPETTSHGWLDWLASVPGMDWQVFVLARKEILNAMRERDVISAVLTSVVMGILLVVMYSLGLDKVGGMEDELTMPIFLAMGLFLGALLHCAMLGSAAIGAEGKKLWIFKSLPVKAKLVLRAKAVALMFLSIPSMLIILLPLPIVAGFPWAVTVFFMLIAVILVLSLTGMGLYVGAMFANFDDANRGQPDFMVQFMIMAFASILGLVLLALPAAVMLGDRNNGGTGFIGLAATTLMLLVSYAVYRASISGAAVSYRRIDIEAYG